MTVKLEIITEKDYLDILKLTTDKDIIKFIGGDIWTPAQVEEYIKYCVLDEALKPAVREFFSYKITYDGEFAGIIEFKMAIKRKYFFKPAMHDKIKDDVVLTIFLNKTFQGKGIAGKAIDLLIKRIHKYKPGAKTLFSIVKKSNNKMLHVMNKLGFKYVGQITLDKLKESFIVFSRELINHISLSK